jgi:hypothetical protein
MRGGGLMTRQGREESLMKRAVPVAITILAGLLMITPGAALAAGKAVLGLPVLGDDGLAEDLYLYSCTDSSCGSITQLAEYGHITNVPRWPKGKGGPGGPVPQTWVFLTIPEQGYQYYQFWQNTGDCWESCILGLNAQGELDESSTTCAGTVPPGAPTVAEGIPYYIMGAAMFADADCGTPPGRMSARNVLPDRTLTFVNGSLANAVCLQTDSSFEHPECTGSGAHRITSQLPFVISSDGLVDGSNAGVGQVSAVQYNDKGNWTYTGRETSGSTQVYATNLEWTLWPQHDQHSMGPTTIDISLVNGFNVGATLTPDRDCACYIADSEGGVPYFVLYKAGVPMASFPHPQRAYAALCPEGNEAPISGDVKKGCYSSCAKARYHHSPDQDRLCCSGQYNHPSTCTDPPNQPYVINTNSHSVRVYTWAFNDWRGTFTCEPTASFTFTIKDLDYAF